MNEPTKQVRTPYRIEDGRVCIDIRLHTARQLFDCRDPAPFRERDLDQGAAEYILEAADEAPKQHRLKLVVWLTESSPSIDDATMVNAIAAYFRYQEHIVGKQIRGHVREGQIKLVLGFLVLGVFLTLARLCTMLPEGTFRDVLAEARRAMETSVEAAHSERSAVEERPVDGRRQQRWRRWRPHGPRRSRGRPSGSET